LQVTRAGYRLPSAISREVVLARGQDLLIIGGITQALNTTGAIIQLNPVTGRAAPAGQLADPAHDAAGAVLGGRPYLFGGGDQAELAAVQALRRGGTAAVAGQLPGPRSDTSSVTLGRTAYLVGGYSGASWVGTVLATTNGRAFRKVATLPLPVRYAAVAAAGNRIWVFGGLTPAGNSRVIQQVNLATGQARVVGRMPAPISAATAVTLGGRIFIAGGQVTKGGGALIASRKVLAYDPAHRRVTTAGRLPVAVTNAAAAVIGGTAFLVGGNDGQRQVTTVARLRLVAG
jgi:N-acetylneuraminic acid mutarotase